MTSRWRYTAQVVPNDKPETGVLSAAYPTQAPTARRGRQRQGLTPISCHAVLERSACAPFIKERRMKCISATGLRRKSGQMGHPNLRCRCGRQGHSNSPSALAAGFARICVGAFGLGRGFGHVCAGLRRTVILRTRAVIDLGGRVQPDQARTTTRSWGCRCWRRCLGLGCRSSRGSSRGGSRRRCSWSGRRCGGGRVPGLHAFVAAASAALARARPVGPIIAQPGSTSGGPCRGLGNACLRSNHCGYGQRGNRQHRTDQCLHIRSS
jgi:hypothetical protein